MQMKMVKVIVFIAGIFMLSASIFGFWHIFYTYKKYIHTVCIVEKLHRKKVYKYRKMRYEDTMVISYETDKYGKLYTTLESNYPFRKVGDKLILWYDPNYPRNIKLPISEVILSIFFAALGVMCISTVFFLIKIKI